MRRRGVDRVSLHERIHGTPPPAEPPAVQTCTAANSEQPALRHCWVNDKYGKLPGLLLEWRRTVSGWQRPVVRPVLKEGCWMVVGEWLPAAALGPAD
jgi:hypothetical protein